MGGQTSNAHKDDIDVDHKKIAAPRAYQLPTSGNVKKLKKPISERLSLWWKGKKKGKQDFNFDTKWDDAAPKWKPGMTAYSQILNGPYNGTWIEVIVTAVHANGKIDLKIPEYKKYRVFATAVEVPNSFVKRFNPSKKTKPLPVWKPGSIAYSQILSGKCKGTWIPVIVKHVHPDGRIDLYIPDYQKYKVYAHALEVPPNFVVEKPPEGAKVEEYEPPMSPTYSDDETTIRSQAVSDLISPRGDKTKMEHMTKIVRVIMNLDCDSESPPTQEMLEKLWVELDADEDGILCDEELLAMLVAIAEAWKQKTTLEFESIQNQMESDIGRQDSEFKYEMTNQYRDHLINLMDSRIKNIQDEAEKHVTEVKAELDLDFDGKVSKEDFLTSAPFVLFASAGTEI